MKSIYEEIVKIREEGVKAALCIVTGSKGSTPRKIGSKMIVREDGSIYDTIGGGNLEKEVIKNAVELIKLNKAESFKHNLLHQHNMCCGGTMEIYIETILKKKIIYIFGAGHTGEALARLMVKFDFDVFIIDDRDYYINAIEIPAVNKMKVNFDEVLSSLPFDDLAYVVIMTYSHPVDRNILAYCIKKPHAYLGMIGSKRKVEITKKMFVDRKIATVKELSGVDMPMGIDIKADGPEEIALSIAAKLVETKNLALK